MNILVTGASGFIGSHLCEALCDAGHIVTGLDNNLIGREENLRSIWGQPNFHFVMADVSSNVCQLNNLGRFDFIFHLASPTAPAETYRHPEVTLAVNSQGVLHLMSLAERQHAGFLFTSSVKVSDAVTFNSEYIQGKKNGEQFTLANPAFKVARFGNVYGPRMARDDSRVIPTFCRNIIQGKPLSVWGDGSQVDSFCYVSDAVAGLMAFMESPATGVIEFGSGEPTTILNLAYMMVDALGVDVPIAFEQAGGAAVVVCNNQSWSNNRTCRALAAKARKVPDLTRAKQELGWAPVVSLEDGIQTTYQYYYHELMLA